MRIDLNKYIINRDFIQKWYLDQTYLGYAQCISTMAIACHTPCIVVAFYIGEITDWPQEILNSISRYIDFYDYREITGIPEGYKGRRL